MAVRKATKRTVARLTPATGSFDQFAAKYRGDPAWSFHELKTGHDAMILVPEELTALLVRC